MYRRYEEIDCPFNRDHITEAYGPTAADAAICGLEDSLVYAGEDADPKWVAEIEAEIASLRRQWGL